MLEEPVEVLRASNRLLEATSPRMDAVLGHPQAGNPRSTPSGSITDRSVATALMRREWCLVEDDEDRAYIVHA